ncbi:hypothetical protein BT63DRAFT_424657 [Microthyrium microscopicum]|uniref:F-box domain-containing protein n=1 Tax=Microthyrium microscopicum TaxID=703497 RepID=A0A6A6UCU2_9PEZI|nr:hypothetical protein BT63DRAFT_424657 [Microthyrium microscopicum]
MEGLPVELLLNIFEVVANSHRPSIRDIALVNKGFYTIAARFLYYTVRINIQDEERFSNIVHSISPVIIQNIRCLVIEQPNDSECYRLHEEMLGDKLCKLSTYPKHTKPITGNAYFPTTPSPKPGNRSPTPIEANLCLNGINKDPQRSVVHSIASLIEEIPRLQDLIFACPMQLPPSILFAIHAHHRNCRLQLHGFDFRAFRPNRLDPYDLMLASSPCLFDIMTDPTDWVFESELRQYLREVLTDFLSVFAPNLQELTLMYGNSSKKVPLLISSVPWMGFKSLNIVDVPLRTSTTASL